MTQPSNTAAHGGAVGDLIAELVQALRDEERARDEVRAAVGRQANLLRALRTVGMPTTLVAHRLGVAQGMALPIHERLRMARRLQQRALRATSRRADLAVSHGLVAIAPSPLDRAIPPVNKGSDMAKLVKRTITEEFIEDQDDDQEAPEAEDADESDDQDDDSTNDPKRSRRRR